MHIEEQTLTGYLQLQAYNAGSLTINDQVYREPVCLTLGEVMPLGQLAFSDLQQSHFQVALDAKVELILVGTGEKQQFLHPRLTSNIVQAAVGIEVMSTAAACRTYMILQAEHRRMWAYLWP